MNVTARVIEPWYDAQTGKKNSVEFYRSTAEVLLATLSDNSIDLIVTSPPYCMGMEYETSRSASDFLEEHRSILPEVERVLRPGGSACWQVGHHVNGGVVTPLDALVYGAAREVAPHLVLRNRIVWTFGHGLHSPTRFSGRHETILWFTKGGDYTFNLDAVRVPQKYPGKRHYKGTKKGAFSGNPLGKNPSDVWDIPNVKARHVEKTDHPCQFPVAIPRRLILALTKKNSIVLDPYMGSGSTAVAAVLEGRAFVGGDIKEKYLRIARTRVEETISGLVPVRVDSPPRLPKQSEAVSKLPKTFETARRKRNGDL